MIRNSIIVISFHKIARLEVCLETAYAAMGEDDELMIIDNSGAKAEDVRSFITTFCRQRLRSRFILNSSNRFFSAAVNQGILNTSGEFVFLVNNDIEIIDQKTFSKLSCFAESNGEVGTVTPITVRSNGHVYCSGAYGTGAHRHDMINKPRETEWNNFAFVCLKRKLLNAHGLLKTGRAMVGHRECDCNHFHSDEEYCRRLSLLGFKHIVYPVVVRHFHTEG